MKDDVAKELVEVCKGDMRKVVNLLQSMKLSLMQEKDISIDKEKFFEIVGSLPQEVVKQIFDVLCTKDYTASREGELNRSKRYIKEL